MTKTSMKIPKLEQETSERAKDYLIFFENISKYYNDTVANENITFGILPGTIHGILGENGAGKTTLVNILCGRIKPSKGNIYISGNKVSFSNPSQAIKAGIGLVHQNLSLLNALNIWENLALSESHLSPVINSKKYRLKVANELFKSKIQVNPEINIWKLSMGEKQQIEIFRTLYQGFEILVALDEPTSLLTPNESILLRRKLRDLANNGKTIIYISHKLNEIEGFVDRITLLKNGRIVQNCSIEDTSIPEIVSTLFGNKINANSILNSKKQRSLNEPLFELKSLSYKDPFTNLELKDISIKVCKGEILGIAGIAGNGQKALAEIMCGKIKKFTGERIRYFSEFFGNSISPYIPEDVIEESVAMNLTIFENILVSGLSINRYNIGPFIIWKRVIEQASRLMEEYGISPNDPYLKIRSLSGGNIQKLVLARELNKKNVPFLIAHNPTKGLDLKTTQDIHNIILELSKSGFGIVILSEDLDELLCLCDRIFVMKKGKIINLGETQKISKVEIGEIMVESEANFY